MEISQFYSKYIVGDLIRSGGNGSVYYGLNKQTGDVVAIKSCPIVKHNSEIKMMQKVSNVDGVVRLLDVCKESDRMFLVLSTMERCEDLYDYINHAPFSIKNVKYIFKQIVTIVYNVFKEGVFHRDIKDENFLVDLSTLDVVLIDFGAAVPVSDEIYTDLIGVTEIYASPEALIEGKYTANLFTVWQLGIVLYILMEGNCPFKDEEFVEFGIIEFKTIWPKSIMDLLVQMTELDIDKRISLEDVNNITSQW
jgi:serine/threonine protein kinase